MVRLTRAARCADDAAVACAVETKDGAATFVARGKLRTPTGEIDQIAAFRMVREDARWRFSLD